MSLVNKEKIITLTSEVQQALQFLKEYARLPAAEVIGNRERLGNLKYQFIVALEACIDICQHVSAKLFSQAPESYANCFEILRQKNVLDESLSEQMAELARFRNVLVHLYWKVDDARVVENLHKLHAVDSYLRAIATLVR